MLINQSHILEVELYQFMGQVGVFGPSDIESNGLLQNAYKWAIGERRMSRETLFALEPHYVSVVVKISNPNLFHYHKSEMTVQKQMFSYNKITQWSIDSLSCRRSDIINILSTPYDESRIVVEERKITTNSSFNV